MQLNKGFFFLTMILVLLACEPDKGDYLYATDDPKTNANRRDQSDQALEDYRNTNRDIWQKPELIIELLGDLRGKTVADIGAGTGFFTMRLAPNADRVIATDIEPGVAVHIDSVASLELDADVKKRVEVRITPPNDPMLKENEVDAVLIVNTFPLIANKTDYLNKLKKGISAGGKLMIVDFKRKRTPIGPSPNLRMPLFEVEELLYQRGFRNIQTNDTFLDYQWIITAEVGDEK